MAYLEALFAPEDVLDPKHTALIVIDMQNDCCSPEGIFAKAGRDVSSIRRTIPVIASLLETCRGKDILTVFLQQTTLPKGQSDPDAWLAFKTRDGKSPEYCLLNSWGWAFIPELAPLPDEIVVPKFRPSGFYGTFLDQLLRANGIRTVVICGNTTEGCVMATVLDASFAGYYTCLAENATASSVNEMHETAVKFMRTRFRVLGTDEILSLWNHQD